MKKIIKLTAIICLIVALFTINLSALTLKDSNSYTYSNDQKPMAAPMSHEVEKIITAQTLGIESLKDVADITVYDNKLYILEKTQGRIFVLDEKYNAVDTLGEDLGLKEPEGFYVNDKGIYISDTQNRRIVKIDKKGKFICQIGAPDSKKTLSSVEFLPGKIIVDEGERLYVIVKNETNGIYQLSIDGEFLGFFGSVPVVPSLSELFWRSISTKEQLSRMLLFVPTEYSSMDIDNDGFIYTTVATNTSSEIFSYIQSGGSDSTLAPIRRLNPKNIDVLKRTGSMPPAGDLLVYSEDESGSGNASRFADIAVREDGTYCVVDSTRSRVFSYDDDGNLLYIFGNQGDTEDTFVKPNCICWWDKKIVVSDIGNACVKIFSPTKYATLIDKAISAERAGDYETSALCWNNLLTLHSGSNLAFNGLGKLCVRSGEYKEAMEWFKNADNQDYYSNAMKLYRQEIGVKVVGGALFGIIAIVILTFVGKTVYKKKTKDNPSRLAKNNPILKGIKYGFYIMCHPFDGFWDMQYEKRGNIRSATVILSLTVVFNLIGAFANGYLIAGNKDSNFNILVSGILSVLLPFGLWCVANWSVTSLMNGSGNFKNIYMYSCYSLTPLLISMPVMIVMSNVITLDEKALYSIMGTLFYIWVGFLLFSGTLTIHQFTASRTVVTILVIIIAMGILIFLGLLCITIAQQMTDFISLLAEEISLRI